MNQHDCCLLHHLCFSFAFVPLDPSLLCGLFSSKLGNPQKFLDYMNKQLLWLVLAGVGLPLPGCASLLKQASLLNWTEVLEVSG